MEKKEIKVLMIDDNPGDARLISEMLAETTPSSYLFAHSVTLADGVRALSGASYDAVLLDIGLPDSSGLNSVTEIKRAAPRTPVVMLTGLDDEETAVSALKLGVQDYLVKGQIDSGLLVRSLRYAIERKRVEAELQEKQHIVQRIAEATPNILYIFDIIERRLIYANSGLNLQLGHTPEGLRQMGASLLQNIIHTDDLPEVASSLRNGLRLKDDDVMDVTLRVRHASGEWRWLHTRSVVFSRNSDGIVKEVLGSAQDITGQKAVESELRRHREELMEIVEERTAELQKSNEELALEISGRVKTDRIVKTTNELLKLFPARRSRKDYLKSVVKIIREWSGCRCVGIRVLNERGEIPYEHYAGFGQDFWKSENRLSISKDRCVCMRVISGQPEPGGAAVLTQAGSWHCDNTSRFFRELPPGDKIKYRRVCEMKGYKSVAVVPVRFLDRTFAAIHLADEEEGKVPLDMIEALETMTPLIGEAIHRFNMEDELMQNYLSLQSALELLENVFSNVHVLIAYMDTGFNFITVNNKYAEAEGREPAFFTGKNHFDLYPDGENEAIFRKVVETGEPYYAKAEPFVRTDDPERGTTFRDWSLKAVKNAEGKVGGLVLSLIDVTENITLYSELMRSEHLASIGELAAGVAHEVNNPINGIINYAQMLLNRCKTDSRDYDIAARIIRESDRIAGIVKSLLSFARGSGGEKRPVQVSEILSESLTLTEAQLKKDGISLEIVIPPDLPRIFAQPQQIEQVMLNLISNACHALNRKYPEKHAEKIIRVSAGRLTADDGRFVRITFQDNGIGIPEGIRDRIMDPFFTTKSAEGTGLGLSISHGIISDHGGRIKIESNEGEFTRVIMDLPADNRQEA
ncbi:MAG: response regulator [Nitrospiraceae bacterium]|nr:MAG: response regulator [Nitrospiraceae bacterium]